MFKTYLKWLTHHFTAYNNETQLRGFKSGLNLNAIGLILDIIIAYFQNETENKVTPHYSQHFLTETKKQNWQRIEVIPPNI